MNKNQSVKSISYKDAGVDIDAGNQLIKRISPIAKKTARQGVLNSLGGFGALFEMPTHYKRPVLVSATDGVGTKLRLALSLKKHDTIGIDLVAMCVNDLIVMGAEPLFFLDYYATGQLDIDTAEQVISGIGLGCEMAGAALVGGETAEMPGMYSQEDYDLAGFCVGAVEKSEIIDGTKVEVGQSIIAIASSGPHSNGYSLIRKVIEATSADLNSQFGEKTLGETLLEPTRIYVKPILTLLKKHSVFALSHITGGGLLENIPRVLPDYTQANINTASWSLPPIFSWLKQGANLDTTEMFRTFNCGVGMVLVVHNDEEAAIISALENEGEKAWVLGSIVSSSCQEPSVKLV